MRLRQGGEKGEKIGVNENDALGGKHEHRGLADEEAPGRGRMKMELQ